MIHRFLPRRPISRAPPLAVRDWKMLRCVEENAARIPDAVLRLRYLRRSVVSASRASLIRRNLTRAFGLAGFVGVLLAALFWQTIRSTLASQPLRASVAAPAIFAGADKTMPRVWLADRNAERELYSNGLRIEREVSVGTRARAYRVLAHGSLTLSEIRFAPAGIVFPMTESKLASFDAHHNASLKRTGQELLAYVRDNRSYHFLIDLFGTVHRVTAETDYANHAGFSVWADAGGIYVNLNQSFLGLAFEAQTGEVAGSYSINRAQIYAGRVLTEMLRSKYQISDGNCVTHAQVSVNPRNLYLGYHTDWAGGFPFAETGLEQGYAAPVPSVVLFGFRYDAEFLRAMGGHTWKGLVLAEEQLVRDAAAGEMTPETYRKALQKRYTHAVAELRGAAAAQENADDGS